MEERYETLEAITDGIQEELRKRYPLLEVIRYKLAAPGFKLGITHLGQLWPREFAVKVTAIGLLVDEDDPEPPAMHRRVATIEYNDPRMLESLFEVTDKFVVDGRLVERW